MTLADAASVVGGLVAGLLSGALGIGGGLVFVPILTLGFRVTQTIAQGTSLAAIVPTALVGGVTHLRQRNSSARVAAWVGGGGVFGAIAGALIAVHLAGGVLARVFGAFYIAAALLLLQRALAEPKPPPERSATATE